MRRPTKTLVTGGAGFIGSHLCEALVARGHHVICIDSMLAGRRENLASLLGDPRFELIERDVTAPPPAGLDPDEIYALACAASPQRYQADPIHTMMTCVLGTRNYLELARSAGARFLLASTSEVYGDPERHPQSEDYLGAVNTTGPRACYDEGKRAAESLTADYRRVAGVQVRIARIFNTYGPRMADGDGRVVSNFVQQAARGGPLTIYGDGSQTRSFCYVDDTVGGLLDLMESSRAGAQPINLGNPDEFTIAEVARLVMALSGTELSIEHHPLPQDDPKRRRPDISRAWKLLGWRPTTSLETGLARMMRAHSKEVAA